jgi:peptidoglycan hydrolase-like protein with peptidoglycan-binding domain
VADHVFDPNHVDSQLGTAVILHAMMSQDSSINFDDSPSIVPHSEPDQDAASSVLLMQQTLNRLGTKPPLAEDGISGPKTKAAVSLFQQQNGLQDTGLLDGTTIAAITRAGMQPVQTPSVDLSRILSRLESLAQLLQGGGTTKGGTTSGPVISGGTTTVANDPISLLERLLALANNAAPTTAPTTSGVPASAPADQLKPIVDLLSTLLNKDGKPVLGQVNGALGETIGKMLNGKKTALGIGGTLITALLSAVTASPNAGGLAGLLGTIASAVPGLSQFALPISLALTAWGVLGKMEKWAQGTAPPPKVTT